MSTSACLASRYRFGLSPFGFEDPVQPGDVAVLGDVVSPGKLLEPFVSLELAEDPVIVPAQPKLAAEVLPAAQLLPGDVEQVQQLAAAPVGQYPNAFDC